MPQKDSNSVQVSPMISLCEKSLYRDGIRMAAPFHGTNSTGRLELKNQSQKWVAFRLKCTHPEHFKVKPRSVGLIGAGNSQEICLSLLSNYSIQLNYYLLIETTFIRKAANEIQPETLAKNDILAIWAAAKNRDISTSRFPIYVSLLPPDTDLPKLTVFFDEPPSNSLFPIGHLLNKAAILYRNETVFSNGLVVVLLACQCLFLYFSVSSNFLS